jgi:hypothetical protein
MTKKNKTSDPKNKEEIGTNISRIDLVLDQGHNLLVVHQWKGISRKIAIITTISGGQQENPKIKDIETTVHKQTTKKSSPIIGITTHRVRGTNSYSRIIQDLEIKNNSKL